MVRPLDYGPHRQRPGRFLPHPALFLAAAILATACATGGEATSDGDLLRYRWKEGETYCYRISCKAEIADMLLEADGSTTYTFGRAPEATPLTTTPEPVHGSGTAFIVSADGYLLTCNHVVHGATEIKAAVGDQTMPCEIVATDSAHDLAVLHVDRHGLPALPLGDSEAVQLAEEVRVVGYPLSDVLGSNVKITQGSVAGILAKRRTKTFQIDAMVNPGNSGGPLLDGRGAVIGVINAQLVGRQIFKVGFAVPVNYAKAMLTERHIAFQTAAGGGKLDGPALAKRVVPSVAFVTVVSRGDEFLPAGQPRLKFHAVLDRNKRQRSLDAVSSPIGDSQRDDGQVVADEYGEISHQSSHVELPCLLGPLGTVVIDSLPAAGEQTTWRREEMITIAGPSRGSSDDPLGGIRPSGFPVPDSPPRLFGGFRWRLVEPKLPHPATREVRYSTDAPKGGTQVIHKHVELASLEADDANPKLELVGTGETVFDLKAGIPQKITFSGKFTLREESQTLTVPVTLVCTRATEKEQPPAAAGKPAAGTPAPTAPPATNRLSSALADLRAADKDWDNCFRALEELSLMAPVENRREEVAEVLNSYLVEKNYSARSSALRAVQTWGTPRNVPALISLLNSSESASMRQRAIEILARWNDPRAAAAIAQRLKEPADRAAASRALKTLGRPAEDATIALLADEDPQVRDAACLVLGEIGGAKSIAALKERASKEKDVAARVREVLEKLQRKP
jgi:S1-C subfamily serine protease